MNGTRYLAVLIPLAYATSPEVFVRSGYGGHFACSNFAAVLLLMVLEQRPLDSRRIWWLEVLLAGAFSGLVNQKLVLLPVAVVIWEFLCGSEKRLFRRAFAALLHPAAVGFVAGSVLFGLWGLAVDPGEFWQDYLRMHSFDRLLHHNPMGHGGYPSMVGLWIELWQHTGYVLLPLGIATLAALVLYRNIEERSRRKEKAIGDLVPFAPGLWLVWALLMAIVFSLVDWRQTKHLMPLLIPLHLAPARWAASSNVRLGLIAVLLAGLTVWNLYTLCQLAENFAGFQITPKW